MSKRPLIETAVFPVAGRGTRLLQATVALALAHPQLGKAFRAHLRRVVKGEA